MEIAQHVTRIGFEKLLLKFREEVIPRTLAIKEWRDRTSVSAALIVSKSTSIDLANEILAAAIGSDSNGKPDGTPRKGKPQSLCYPFAAIAIDPVLQSLRAELGRRLPRRLMQVPNDSVAGRKLYVRIDQRIVRMQAIFYATETQSAAELAVQWTDYIKLSFQGRIACTYTLLGAPQTMTGMIIDRDILPVRVDTGLKNVYAFAVDSDWRVAVPTLYDKNGIVEGIDSAGVTGIDLIVQAIVYKEYADPETVLLESAE